MPEVQQPLFPPRSAWSAPRLSELPSWKDAKRLCIDVETRDEQLKQLGPGVRRGGYIAGFAFAIEDGPAHYLPLRHEAGGNVDLDQGLRYLGAEAAKFKGELVGANLGYDLDFCEEAGIQFRPRMHRDVQVAEVLIDELQDSYALDDIATRHGLPGKDETLLRHAAADFGFDPKADLWRLHPKYVGPYGTQDVRLPLQLLRRQERLLEEQELWPIYDLESRVLPVLVKMRRRGVRFSFERLERVEAWTRAKEAEALAELKRVTGRSLSSDDVWKTDALAKLLTSLGVQLPRTSTGKLSVTKDVLKAIDHPAAGLIRQARRVNKIRTTFCASVREHAIFDRIHCTFNQCRRSGDDGDDEDGARYGRLSCVDPNMQQQPARDPEIGPMWRSIYIPDEGAQWAQLDFSQQEPRWLIHFAEKIGCTKAREAAERYRRDPRTDNHTMMSQMIAGQPDTWKPSKEFREECKQTYLGLCYGMGGAKLCRKVNKPTKWVMSARRGKMVEVAGDEGQALLDRFHNGAPFIRELSDACSRRAAERGWIRTALGRKCHFPKKGDGSYDWTHTGLNRLVQGSSADQTKKAVVDCDAAGIPLQLQVHDELDLSVHSREVAEQAAHLMRNAVPASVPFLVDAELGPSWGECK